MVPELNNSEMLDYLQVTPIDVLNRLQVGLLERYQSSS